MKDDIKKQINDIIEGEIQNGINDYIEQEGRGFDLSLIHISEPTRPY